MTQPGTKLTAVLAITYLVFILAVVWQYWQRNTFTLVSILAYLNATTGMALTVKVVFKTYNYRFPKFLTATHLLASSLTGLGVLLWRRWRWGTPFVVPTLYEMLSRILPMSLCFGLSIGLNNSALVLVSAMFAEIMNSTTPVVSIPVTLLVGLPFNMILLFPTLVVVLGAIVSVEPWSLHISGVGVVLCQAAVLCRAVKAVLQQETMTGQLRERFEPITLLVWLCGVSAVGMQIWSLAQEGLQPYRFFASPDIHLQGLVGAMLVSTVNAVVLNLTMLFVTKELGAIACQLIAQTKAVLVVLGGMALFQEQPYAWECVGLTCILLGTFTFNRLQAWLSAKQLK